MSYSIHLCQDWDHEKIAPYNEAISAAMGKLAARFPHDVALDMLARQIASGDTQLWLILDERQQFVAFVTSQIEITLKGKKRLNLLELAGRGGLTLVPMLEKIEQWAREQGVNEICPVGRIGWQRALAKQGFKPFITRYRKELQ